METQYQNMMATFFKMLQDLNRYFPTEKLQYFLDNYEKLDMARVSYKLCKNLSNLQPCENIVKYLENNDLYLLPEINLSTLYKNLSSAQKTKVELYIKILLTQSEIINSSETKKRDINDIANELGFNPFNGIQPNKNSLDLADITKCIEQIEAQSGESSSLDLENVLKMFGLDKVINFEDMFKNFDETKINESLSTIKSFMKDTMSNETAEMMDDIVSTTLGELKNKNIKSTSDLMNVCSTLKDKIESKNHSLEKIMQDTGKMLDKMKENSELNKIPEAKTMLDLCSKLLNNPNTNESDLADAYKFLIPSMKNIGTNMSKKR